MFRNRAASPTLTVVLLALGLAAQAAAPDDVTRLKKENADLRSRVGTLESQVQRLTAAVNQLVAGRQPVATTQAFSAQEVEEIKRIARSFPAKRRPIVSGINAQLYGKVKFDAAYDTARTSVGNFARWVESEENTHNDDQFNMTANETRLGLKLSTPDAEGIRTTGVVELDLYGSNSAENKAKPMLRHAFLEMHWPESRFSILAGQTWDVISPLNPGTLNYSVQWWEGNIGYRRPQVRLTKELALSSKVDLKLQGAFSRTIGHDGPFDPGDTGEDAGFPTTQGRLALSFPCFGPKPTTVGVSGHWGEEEYDTDAQNHARHFQSWSANVDLTQPVTDWLTVKAEAFVGENLDAYLGGIGQGLNTATYTEIGSAGGWVAAAINPCKGWHFNLGASMDNVSDSDVTAASARTAHRCFFGNIIHDINKWTSVGLELSHRSTEYKGMSDGDSLRIQSSFILKF